MWRYVPFTILGFILALACVGGVEQASSSNSAPQEPDLSELDPEEARTVSVFRKACCSVVYITNMGKRRHRDIFSMFLAPDSTEIPQGSGSGFMWDDEGHIVTNFHVIRNASSLTVMLPDQTSWEAEVVGVAPDKDMAVLRIDAPVDKLKPIQVGTSENLQVGQKVMAIGNPFGLDQTLTTGIVSALGRQIKSVTGRTILDVIQTDAAINPGNSGGPLLDSKGRLIGINTAIVSPTGSSAGIGFAVPVITVNKIVPQLIKYHGVIRPGLQITMVDDWRAMREGIEGVIIKSVEPGSAAARAGLEGWAPMGRNYYAIGDVIIGVDKWRVRNSDELQTALEKFEIGDEITVHVLRGGKDREEVDVVLEGVR
ncbi:MAG: S1C family serine protease [Planctomycetota bacterium]